MDERRSIPIEPDARPAPPTPRRGTPLWKQILASIAVLIIAAAIWFALRSDDLGRVLGLVGIMPPPSQEAQAPAQGPGQQQPGQPQAQQPGQGQQPGAGNPRPGQGNFPGGGRNRTTAVVVTAKVATATINDKLIAIGEGTAFRSATVTAPASGTLVSVAVQAGDTVDANAEIAALDSQSEQIAFDRASLAAKDAQDALTRANELRQSNSISAVQLSAAQLAADQAALELRNAELALSRRRIESPIAGKVGLLQVSPGNAVNAQTVVTTVEDSSEILINFWVPERYASVIATGMPVTALAVALPGQSFAGEVSAVDNRIDPASRTLQVQARLPNPDGKIRPGMSFEVTMSFPGDTFPTVDPLSIQWSADGAYVWRYADGKVQQAMVQIVERNSGGVLVTGDIKEGDEVVTQGVLQLQNGQAVRLLDEARAGQQQGQGQPPPGGQQQGQGQQQPGGGAPPGQGG